MYLPNSQVNPGSLGMGLGNTFTPQSTQNTIEDETLDVGTVDIAVHVTDGENPVGQVEVSIDENIIGTTGNAGGCTLRNVSIGECTITAFKEGYIDYSEEITITSETEEINITLTNA